MKIITVNVTLFFVFLITFNYFTFYAVYPKLSRSLQKSQTTLRLKTTDVIDLSSSFQKSVWFAATRNHHESLARLACFRTGRRSARSQKSGRGIRRRAKMSRCLPAGDRNCRSEPQVRHSVSRNRLILKSFFLEATRR